MDKMAAAIKEGLTLECPACGVAPNEECRDFLPHGGAFMHGPRIRATESWRALVTPKN